MNSLQLLKDIKPGKEDARINSLTVFKDQLYFGALSSDDDEQVLWKSDGTTEGTVMVTRFEGIARGAEMSALTKTEEKMFFLLRHEDFGEELYVSDGTASGTYLVKDINPGERDSYIRDMTPFRDGIAFVAEPEGKQSLWISDGTETGTFPITAPSSSVTLYGVTNGMIFFNYNLKLWRTDGSPEGTIHLLDDDLDLRIEIDELIFFNE